MERSKILIVDDNPEIREIIEILLTGEGFESVQAKDGITALRLLKEQDFDLIILDIMMPGMNGYQTCLEIRKSNNAPILFLSARTKDSDKTLGFSSGGDDYLAKPFSYNELISRVKALIRRYHIYKGKDVVEKTSDVFSYHSLTIDEKSEEIRKKRNFDRLDRYRISNASSLPQVSRASVFCGTSLRSYLGGTLLLWCQQHRHGAYPQPSKKDRRRSK